MGACACTAASTAPTTCRRGSTRSSRSTSTCRAARRPRRLCPRHPPAPGDDPRGETRTRASAVRKLTAQEQAACSRAARQRRFGEADPPRSERPSESPGGDIQTFRVGPAALPALARCLKDDPRARPQAAATLRRRLPRPRRALRGGLPPATRCTHGHRAPAQGAGARGRPDAAVGLPGLEGGRLVRARGVRPVRHPLRGPPEPEAHPAATTASRATRCARTTTPASAGCCTEDEHGTSPSRAPRGAARTTTTFETQVLNIGPSHPATHGTLRTVVPARRRGDLASESRDRLPPPLLREDGGDPHLAPGDPVHRPAQLLLVDDQRRRLRLAVEKMLGIEVPPRAQAIRGHPLRVLAHHGPLRLHRREPRRPRRADQLLVHLPAARGDLRLLEACCRRPPDRVLRAHRRPRQRRARPTSRRRCAGCSGCIPPLVSTTSRS